MRAVLFGATGLVGSSLLRQLIKDPDFREITIFTRKPLLDLPLKVIQHTTDLEIPILVEADFPESADVIFIATGTTIQKAGSRKDFEKIDYEMPLNIAKIAEKKSVKSLILISSSGADPKSGFFYTRVKGKLEEALRSGRFHSTYILRPGLLLGSRKENRPAEKLAQWVFSRISFLFTGPFRKYAPVHADIVAGAMRRVSKIQQPGFHILEPDYMKNLNILPE